MSYTNETTHYSIPKPLGTDLTVPMDYNEAADAIDQALFDASTNATEAVTAANNAVEAAAEAVDEVGSLGTEVNNLKGRTSALETSDVIQNNKIDALENQGATKFDSAGIADPYVNGLTYSVGDVVTYNGQRYKCITAVVAAEPFDADKWSAEDVETVLNDIKSDLTNIETKVFPTVISVSIGSDYGHIADAVIAAVPADKITKDTVIVVDGRIFRFDNTSRQFSNVNLNSSTPELYIGVLAPNGVAVQSTINASGASIQDISSFAYTGSVDVYL